MIIGAISWSVWVAVVVVAIALFTKQRVTMMNKGPRESAKATLIEFGVIVLIIGSVFLLKTFAF